MIYFIEMVQMNPQNGLQFCTDILSADHFLNRKKLLFDKVLSKGYVLDRLNQIYNSVKVDSKF